MTNANLHSESNADPLAHRTIGARLLAAHHAAGLSTADVARALDLRYQTVLNWHNDQAVPGLEQFRRACELTAYTCQEILYGAATDHRSRVLPREAVRKLLAELQMPSAARAAFARWHDSPEGRYEDLTRECVLAWVAAYRATVNTTADEAREQAIIATMQTRALRAAVDAGAKPIDTATLAAGVAARRRKVTHVRSAPAPTPAAKRRTAK